MTQTSIRCAQISTRQTSLAAPMPLDDAALQQVAGGVLSYTTGPAGGWGAASTQGPAGGWSAASARGPAGGW